MSFRVTRLSPGRSRPGKTLVMFALLLPVLLGMVGLVIDCGLMIAAQRSAQNAADAAALAAAMVSLSGQGDPESVAKALIGQYNGLAGASSTNFNNPPAAGPHAGSGRHFEVVITCPVTTLFMPVLRVDQNQFVQARAVAGYESIPSCASVATLDPTASPGIRVENNALLALNGRLLVNSAANPAALADDGSQVEAAAYQIVGSTISGAFSPYPATQGTLSLNQAPMPDPLINLATPATLANNSKLAATPLSPSWSPRLLGSPQVADEQNLGIEDPNYVDDNGIVQLYPGIYKAVNVSGGTVNFNTGVYVLSPEIESDSFALSLTGGTISGSGVMFYNTGGDYVPDTGYPDHDDRSLYDPGPSGTSAPPSGQDFQNQFGGINIDASTARAISLSALSADGDPFRGILFYQRRANTQSINITGGNLSLIGTFYAKWAPINLIGGGNYQAQFIAGSLNLSGPSTLTLTSTGLFATADNVFLVE
jgi:hypothetical protein